MSDHKDYTRILCEVCDNYFFHKKPILTGEKYTCPKCSHNLSKAEILRLQSELAEANVRATTAEAQVEELVGACKAMVEYRDRVGAMGWQLEKADDFIRNIRSAISRAEGKEGG